MAAMVGVVVAVRPRMAVQVRHACEDLDILRRRLRELEGDIDGSSWITRWVRCSPRIVTMLVEPFESYVPAL